MDFSTCGMFDVNNNCKDGNQVYFNEMEDFCRTFGNNQNEVQLQQVVTLDDVITMSDNVNNCLLVNRIYQQQIMNTIDQLQYLLEDNLEKQKSIQTLLDESSKKKCGQKCKQMFVFSKPYFRDRTGFPQPANEDTRSKFSEQFYDSYSKPPKNWTEEEKDTLKNAIKASNLDKMIKPLSLKIDYLTETLAVEKVKKICNPKTKQDLKSCREEIGKLRLIDDAILLNEPIKDYDWGQIAGANFGEARNESECRLMWINALHLSRNKNPWMSEEDDKLVITVVKFNYHDWDAITNELQTNRTAIQCFERYQRHFNESIRKSIWTEEEDATLFELIRQLRIVNFIPWHQISYYMEGRTTDQVIRRWYLRNNPVLKHGPFSETEDLMLLASVTRFGTNWKQIKHVLTGRSHCQWRDRFVNTLDKSVTCHAWTNEEDEKLIELNKIHGAKWSEIAAFFPGRTDAMVSKRFNAITAKNLQITSNKIYLQTRTRNQDYRQKIYEKLLVLLNHDVMNTNDVVNSLDVEKMSSLLNEVSPQKLDAIIDKLKTKLVREKSKRKVLPRATNNLSVVKLDAEELYFKQYFAVQDALNTRKTGRPRLNGGEVEMESNVLPAQIEGISSILSPNATTMSVYKQLLVTQDFVPSFTARNISKRIGLNHDKVIWKDLAEKFVNLFFWPALLSHVDPRPASAELVPHVETSKVKRKYKRVRSRKPKKPWVVEIMKQRRSLKKVENSEQENKTVVDEISVQPTDENENLEGETVNGPPKRKRGRPFGSVSKKQKIEVPVSEIRRSSRVNKNKN